MVYADAYDFVTANFAAPEARDLLPHFRRSKIEELLRNIAPGFHQCVATVELAAGRNCHYSRARFGKLILTESAVDHPNQLVRSAIFRNTLSRLNTGIQLKMYVPIEEQLQEQVFGDYYYGILLHGENPLDRSRLGFARVAFPNPSASYYVENLDLVELCNVDLDEFNISRIKEEEIEEIEDGSIPELKSNIRENKDEQ